MLHLGHLDLKFHGIPWKLWNEKSQRSSLHQNLIKPSVFTLSIPQTSLETVNTHAQEFRLNVTSVERVYLSDLNCLCLEAQINHPNDLNIGRDNKLFESKILAIHRNVSPQNSPETDDGGALSNIWIWLHHVSEKWWEHIWVNTCWLLHFASHSKFLLLRLENSTSGFHSLSDPCLSIFFKCTIQQ